MPTSDPQMRLHLTHVVNALVNETGGTIDRGVLAEVVDEAYDELAESARLTQFLPVLTLRQARLLIHARGYERVGRPDDSASGLIVCGRNAGRSQAAAALLRFYAVGHIEVVTAGEHPADEVNQALVTYLRDHGVELTDYPKRVRPEFIRLADHIVLLGPQEVEVPSDKPVEVWDVPNLSGLDPQAARTLVHRIDDLVRNLVARLLPALEMPPSIFVVRA